MRVTGVVFGVLVALLVMGGPAIAAASPVDNTKELEGELGGIMHLIFQAVWWIYGVTAVVVLIVALAAAVDGKGFKHVYYATAAIFIVGISLWALGRFAGQDMNEYAKPAKVQAADQ